MVSLRIHPVSEWLFQEILENHIYGEYVKVREFTPAIICMIFLKNVNLK